MGRWDIKIIQNETNKNVRISENSQFNNILADNVTVDKNVTARLYGTINKLITIKKGARLYLHGLMYGNIKNEGGELHIYDC